MLRKTMAPDDTERPGHCHPGAGWSNGGKQQEPEVLRMTPELIHRWGTASLDPPPMVAGAPALVVPGGVR